MFAGLFSYGDFNQISGRLAHFPVLYLVAALALAALNYCLRYLRWSYYLQVLKIRVPFRISSLVFLSGLAMSITPGKMGEFLKSYLLRDRCQVPIAASAPVVLMERLTDVTSVILLGLIGLFLLPLSVALLLAVLMLLSGGALFLITSRHSDGLFRLPMLRKWQGQIRSSRDGVKTLASPKVLAVAVVLGTLAWLSEGVALWVILRGLGRRGSHGPGLAHLRRLNHSRSTDGSARRFDRHRGQYGCASPASRGWQGGGLHRHSPGPIGDPVVRRDCRLVRFGLVGQAQDWSAQLVGP